MPEIHNQANILGVPSAPELSIKQQLFVGHLVCGDDATTAARKAGYKDNYTISATATENLSKPKIQNAIVELANKSGLTLEKTFKTVNEAMTATEPRQFKDEIKEIPAWNPRLKASELSLKIHGAIDKPSETRIGLNVITDDQFEVFLQKFGAE